jgi:hypothetical protein
MSDHQDIVPVHGSDPNKQAPKSDHFIDLDTVNLQRFEKSLKGKWLYFFFSSSRKPNNIQTVVDFTLLFLLWDRFTYHEDLEADITHINAKTAPDSIDPSQELFARKLTLLRQFNLFINQQNQSNICDSSFISTFDQQRLLNVE